MEFIRRWWTRHSRIEAIAASYTNFLHQYARYPSYHLLLMAGAHTLHDQREMDMLVKRIPKPWGCPINWLPTLPDDRLLEFLKFAYEGDEDISKGGYCAFTISVFMGTLKLQSNYSNIEREDKTPKYSAIQVDGVFVGSTAIAANLSVDQIIALVLNLGSVIEALKGKNCLRVVVIPKLDSQGLNYFLVNVVTRK